MFGALDGWDILYAAVAAFVLTQLLLCLNRIRRIMTKTMGAVSYRGVEVEAVLKRCQDLFPIAVVNFKGRCFKAGVKVRIVTLKKRIIEGRLIGKNNRDILCVLTESHVVAHEMYDIMEMDTIE